MSLEHVLDLPRRPLATPGRDDAVQLVAVLGAPGHRPEAWLAEQVLAPHRAGETGKEAIARRDDADVLAVLRRPVVERRGVPEPVALALADDAEAVVGGERVFHDAQDRFVEGELDPLPAWRRSRPMRSSVSLVERRDDRERVEDRRQVVGDDEPRTDGRAVGVARDVEEAPERDAVPVEAGAIAVGTRLAVDGDPCQHDGGVDRREDVVAETPRLERSRLEVFHHRVGVGHEALQEGLPGGLPEVERDRLLAPSLDRPEERVAALEGTDRAEEIALAGQLHLDHLRAEVGEERRREGRPDPRAEIEHADAGERTGHRLSPARCR